MQRLTTRHATVRRVPSDSVTIVMVQEFIKFVMGHGEFSHHDIDAVPLTTMNGLVYSLLLNPPSQGIHRPIELIYRRGVKVVGLLFGQQWCGAISSAHMSMDKLGFRMQESSLQES